jgi:hypothetical protein
LSLADNASYEGRVALSQNPAADLGPDV